MSDLLTQQLLKDRNAELLADAEQHRLARLRPPRESLVRIRLTIELQLGRRKLGTVDHVHAS